MSGDAQRMLDALLDSDHEGTLVLPQEKITQLLVTGRLVSVTTFTDHMRPDVLWIEPEEFGNAFDEIVAQEKHKMAGLEAAFTKRDESYPGFINATLGLDEMVITVRGDPGPHVQGQIAQIRVPLADWDDFLVQAQRVRQNAGSGQDSEKIDHGPFDYQVPDA